MPTPEEEPHGSKAARGECQAKWARHLSHSGTKRDVGRATLASRKPDRTSRFVYYRAPLVCLYRPARHCTGAIGLDYRHYRAARRKVDGATRRTSRLGRTGHHCIVARHYRDFALAAICAARVLAGQSNVCRRPAPGKIARPKPTNGASPGIAEGPERHWGRLAGCAKSRTAIRFDHLDHYVRRDSGRQRLRHFHLQLDLLLDLQAAVA